MTALLRLIKAAAWKWEVTCNLCGHSVQKNSRATALERVDALTVRSRLIAQPSCRECRELAEQVDALATERDDLRLVAEMLTDRIASVEQANADLRRNVLAAYEPVQVGDCRKIRHTSPEGAEQHAIGVATRNPGEVFNTYTCRVCPPYPATQEKPWHVGHCPPGATGSLFVERGVLHHWCGCKFSITTGDQVWACPGHTAVAS